MEQDQRPCQAGLCGLRGAETCAILRGGRVSEWLKEPLSKSGKLARASWVRIPPLPPVSSGKQPQADEAGAAGAGDALADLAFSHFWACFSFWSVFWRSPIEA